MTANFKNPYKSRFYIVFMLLIISLTACLVLWVKQANKQVPEQRFYGQGFVRFSNRMDFDTLQMTRYNSLLTDYRTYTVGIREQIWELQEEMLELLSHEEADTLQLNLISNQVAELQHQIRLETFRHLLKIKQISSPEQQQALQWLYRELINDNKLRYKEQPGFKSRGRHRRGR